MKAEVEKLDINKLVNVSSCLNNSKIKVKDLDADKLRTVLVNSKKLSDIMIKEDVTRRFKINYIQK